MTTTFSKDRRTYSSAFIASSSLAFTTGQAIFHRTNNLQSISSSNLPIHPRTTSPPHQISQRARIYFASANADSQHASPERRVTKSPVTDANRKVSVPGVLFLIITYIWSVILFIPMAIAHPFVMWRDKATRRFHDFIAMAWMRCSFGSVRVKPQVVNMHNLPPKDQPAVFVANHTSYLDIYSFAYLNRRIKYVSKAEIFKIPIVGWAMEMAGNIALRRMNRRGQMEAYRKMVDVIKNKLSLVIFPEGTRSATGKLRRFQVGAFRAAKQQKVPVIPVTILGTKECMPSHAWVPLRYPNCPISLIIHPPLNSEQFTVDELKNKSFFAIDSALPPESRTATEGMS